MTPTAMAAPHFSAAPTDGVREAKVRLRRAAIAAREAADPARSGAIAESLLGLDFPAGAAIAGVWPLPGEIDLRPVLAALDGRGHPILLPETPPRGQPLRFRRWRPGAPMRRERFGTECPEGPEAVPDILLVPLLAFDERRFRLGYGGGYYDRTLAALPGRPAIGFAYAVQRVPAVPIEAHDRPLDAIVTDEGTLGRVPFGPHP